MTAATTTPRGNIVLNPHAEEVELHRGAAMAPIHSTTGRRNRIAEYDDPTDMEVSSQPSATGRLPRKGTSTREGSQGQQAGEPSGPSLPSASARRARYQCYDMYGFCVTAEEKAAEDFARHHREVSERDEQSWSYIVCHWKAADREKLKRLCRRGIPQARRRVVWQRLLQCWGVKERHPGLYRRLRSQELQSQNLAGVIDRDLDRTFPTHRLFEGGSGGPGQQMLRNMLRAYANYNTAVGYCQGMGFLAATLILQIEDEEDAFWAFVALMEGKRYRMAAIFSPGFPELQRIFFVFEGLMKKKLPALYRHLHDRHQIQPSFYSVHWFMTVFTYYFNFGLISRIWDMFLCEGWKPVYRIALALMKIEEKNLLQLKSESELLLALKVIQEAKKPDELLKVASSIKFKTATLAKLMKAYK